MFEASEDDMGAYPMVFRHRGNKYEFIFHAIDFYHFKLYLVHNGELLKLNMPDDFKFEVFMDKLIVQPLVEWN